MYAASAEDLDKDAQQALQALYKINPTAETISRSAKAMLVFPKIIKAGLVFGGSYGEGVLMTKSRASVGITSMTQDNRDAAYKLFGGYQLNRNLALEAGYFDLGNFGFVANTSPPGTVSGRARLRGVNLDLVGTIPLTDRFAALARLGAQHASTRDTFTGIHNQSVRCAALPPDDREDCQRRMSGQGTTKGSAESGGIYRELTRSLPPEKP